MVFSYPKIFCICFLLFVFNVFSQPGLVQKDEWHFQNPFPTSNNFNSQASITDFKTILGTDAGFLLFFDKKSLEFDKNLKLTNYDIIDIEFAKNGIGYCLTRGGYLNGWENQIFKTSDYGNSWEIINSGNSFINDLCIVDSELIICVGQNSDVMISKDGGENWSINKINEYGTDLNVVSINDKNEIYVGGQQRTLLKSTDFGESWQQIENSDLPWSINEISFNGNKDEIFVAGEGGIIISFKGSRLETFSLFTELYRYKIHQIKLIGEKLIAVAQDESYWRFNSSVILLWDEIDSTWSRVCEYQYLINELIELNDNSMLALGEGGHSEIIDLSSNNTISFIDQVYNDLAGISFIESSSEGFALSDSGEVLHTVDYGDNWNIIKNLEIPFSALGDRAQAVKFIDKSNGWITSKENHQLIIYSTNDEGNSWKKNEMDFYGEFKNIHFFDKQNGIIASDPAQILVTEDGGVSWKNYGIDELNNNHDKSIEQLEFLDNNFGYAVGGYSDGIDEHGIELIESVVLVTKNAGKKWEIIFNSKSYPQPLRGVPISSISMIDKRSGYIALGSGIYFTSDYCKNFILHSTVPTSIKKIKFFNDENGWIVGTSGDNYKTKDGGKNWTLLEKMTNNDLNDAFFSNDSLAWFVGDNGTIIRYGNPNNTTSITKEVITNRFGLHQNYPNPFNPTTKIKYEITAFVKGKTSKVKLEVHNVLGKKVATLVNENKPPGSYEINFNAKNLPSGIYFYRLSIGEFSQSKKMIFLK